MQHNGHEYAVRAERRKAGLMFIVTVEGREPFEVDGAGVKTGAEIQRLIEQRIDALPPLEPPMG